MNLKNTCLRTGAYILIDSLIQNGVEYIFGYSKRYFRKHNNCKVKDLEKNVRDSLSPDVITSPRMWKFERRTWLYQQMYLDIHDANTDIDYNVSYEFLENP